MIQAFKKYPTKIWVLCHTKLLVWVDLSRRKCIFYGYRWRFLAKNVVFRACHKLDVGLPECIGRWELVPINFKQISVVTIIQIRGADYAQHKLKLVPTKIFLHSGGPDWLIGSAIELFFNGLFTA